METIDIRKIAVLETGYITAAEERPTAALVIKKQEKIIITTNSFQMGREDGCGNHFVIRDPLISSKHALITLVEGRYYITDLKSTNGTKLNGNPIDPQKAYGLLHNDSITIGATKLAFQITPAKKKKSLERRTFGLSQRIYRKGDICSEAFIILEGKVEIFKVINGNRISLDVLEKGDVFGESAFHPNGLRDDNAVALEKGEVLVLGSEDIGWIMENSPDTIATVTESLCRKLGDLKSLIKPKLTNNLSLSICFLLSLMFKRKNMEKGDKEEYARLLQKNVMNVISEILFVPNQITERVIETLISLQLVKSLGHEDSNERYLAIPDPTGFVKRCEKVLDEFGPSIFNVNFLRQDLEIMDVLDLSIASRTPLDRLLKRVGDGEIPSDGILLKRKEVLAWLKDPKPEAPAPKSGAARI
jgi:pSer/pThr/pTyr-binding forkhead associated (FHA) protein